jgi:hypothetical protein
MNGLSAKYLTTHRHWTSLGPRILPSDHLAASFVAYDHEAPLNDHLYLAAQQSDDDFLGMTFSYCPTFHQLAESLNVQTNSLIVSRRSLLQSDSDFASLALSF